MSLALRVALMSGGAQMQTWMFNAADKSASVSLSNGGRTMTVSGASDAAVRGTTAKGGGKWYAELHVDALGTGGVSIGAAVSAMSLSGYVGQDLHGTGYASDGRFLNNGTPKATYAAYGAGDVIGVALDITNLKHWTSKNGVWQSGDPAAGTGGVTYVEMPDFIAASARGGAAITLPTLPRYGPPTGFQIWS